MIYNVVFTDLWGSCLASFDRLVKRIAWGAVPMKQLQRLRDNFFNEYADGSLALDWTSIIAYNKGDKVKYLDKGIYEAIKTVPIGAAITDTSYWLKIQDNWIGVRERAKYHGCKLSLEFQLNKWFGTVFLQPDDEATPTPSEIYITNNTLNNNVFLVANSDTEASVVMNSDFADDFVMNDYSFNGTSFTINVPVAVFNALGSNTTDRENMIRSFADKYVIAGVTYNIATY